MTTKPTPPAKPVPTPTAETAAYWQGAAIGQLLLQHCTQCGQIQTVPRRFCAACQHHELQWIQACGEGTVISYSWVERGPSKAFSSPYMLALVELQEGIRLMLNIIGPNAADARIGDTVEIVFEARGNDGFKLPQAQLSRRPTRTQHGR